MRRMRRTWLVLTTTAAAAFLAAGPRDVGAAGTIDTTGATLTSGDAPSRGTVTIDAAADLGAVPVIEDVISLFELPPGLGLGRHDPITFSGLGGPDLHATSDLTLPPGAVDIGRLTIDPGVVVTCTQATTVLRCAGTVRIEGRLVFSGSGDHSVECGKDLVLAGRDESVTTGFYAPDPSAWVHVVVAGSLDVSSDEGASVEIGGAETPHTNQISMGFECGGSAVQRLRGATLDRVRLAAAGGIELIACEGTGSTALVAHGTSGVEVAGCDLGALSIATRGDVRVADTSAGSFAAEADGAVSILGQSSLGAASGCRIEAMGDVTTDGAAAIRGPSLTLFSYGGRVVLGPATDVRGATWLEVEGKGGVELAGSLDSDVWIQLMAYRGDVVLRDGASLTARGDLAEIWAQGSVVAEGGQGSFSARSWDFRSVTGDLDLDVASLTATQGSIVALTNGVVRLRGTFDAARDVQALSRLDAIDVVGATITTQDAGDALSGFVRLASYSSTADISAADATLATGDSDAMSGDVLLQIAASGGAAAQAKMTVTRADARSTAGGVTTRLRGTITSRGRPFDVGGAGAFSAGSVSRRVFLRRQGAAFRGAADGVDVTLRRASGRRATFVLTIREPTAAPGEHAPVAFDRAGLHVRGRFRRPRVR